MTTNATSHAMPTISDRLLSAPALAGLAYVAAWIVGLAIWPSNPAVTDSGREVVASYGAHRTLATAQFLLVEGITAIALAFVVVALARAARRARAPAASRVILTAGLTACVISVAQCVLGVILAMSLDSPAHTHTADSVFELINRLDGVKMLLLATAATTAAVARRELGLPTWLSGVGGLTALALVISGAGYLALDGALAMAAVVSLPLLLVWVFTNAVVLRRTS